MTTRAIVALVAGLAVVAAWMLRYEIVPVPSGGQGDTSYAYKLDRWTGKIRVLVVGSDGPVKEKP